MNIFLFRGLSKPSIFVLGLTLAAIYLSACSWIPAEPAPQVVIPQAGQNTSHSNTAVPTEIAPTVPPPEPEQTQTTRTAQQNTPIESPEKEPTKTEPPSMIQPERENIDSEAAEPLTDIGISDLCQEIGRKLGSVSVEDCLNQNFKTNGGQSVLGRPLAIREFPELAGKQSLGRVLLVGGIHGDEFSAVSITFKWMQILEKYHSGVFHWRFVPVSNPDGLLADNSTRQNQNGVDLNRNFPSLDWDELAIDYWHKRTESNNRRYPGPSAGSEPEVVWLVDQIKQFKPDVIVSVHAPYHLVDYDGPPEAPERLGDLQLSKLGVFPGSLGNYAGVNLDIPVVTIELPYAGILPKPDQISMMWTDLVAWLVSEQSKSSDDN